MNNSSVKLILIFSLTVVITGCTIAPPKQNVIITSAMYNNWHDAVFKECQSKAWEATKEIVIKNFEQVIFTDELIKNIHEHLVKKCSMNSGITI